jgi:hypothetical protein
MNAADYEVRVRSFGRYIRERMLAEALEDVRHTQSLISITVTPVTHSARTAVSDVCPAPFRQPPAVSHRS